MAAPEQSTMISPSLYCVWSAVSPKSRQFREPCNARGNINCDLLNPVKRKRSGFSLYDHFGEVVGVTLTRRDWDLWKHSNMWAGDNGGKSNRDTQDMIGHKNDEHLKRCLSRGESLTNRFPCFTLHPKIQDLTLYQPPWQTPALSPAACSYTSWNKWERTKLSTASMFTSTHVTQTQQRNRDPSQMTHTEQNK